MEIADQGTSLAQLVPVAVFFVLAQESKAGLDGAELEGTVSRRMGGSQRVVCCESGSIGNGSLFVYYFLLSRNPN